MGKYRVWWHRGEKVEDRCIVLKLKVAAEGCGKILIVRYGVMLATGRTPAPSLYTEVWGAPSLLYP